MPSKMRHGLLISVVVISLIVVSFNTSYTDTTNYIYDELNRLIRVEYGDGTKIMYTYDEAGNRKYVGLLDTVPPVTTATPPGGTYGTAQSVTLTCNDDISGCNKIYYTTNGNDPNESSPIYSAPINISVTATLKFFAKDLAGNSEAVKTEAYYIGPESVSTPSNPNGPANGNVGASYTYSSGGAASNYGHSIQYLFDWGDGTNSGWLPVSQTSASHSWSSQGNYLVKAQARCSTHPSVVSSWSGTTSVSIVLPPGNDSYTKSLPHINGTNGSTTFTDSAAGGTHAWTAYGGAQIDTAQSKFGGASGLFSNSGYISAADSADWYFGTSDFTIDFWLRLSVLPGGSDFAHMWSQYIDDNNFIHLGYGWNPRSWYFRYRLNGVYQINMVIADTLSINTWYHVAIVRTGNTFKLFRNGSQVGSNYSSSNALGDLGSGVQIGRFRPTAPQYYLNGWLDEFRISKGIARWTSNFTPPTTEY